MGTSPAFYGEAGRWAIERYNLGEIGELIGLGKAPLHSVVPQPVSQYSIVYFAMPAHSAQFNTVDGGVLQRGTVGEWLKERIARSRTYV